MLGYIPLLDNNDEVKPEMNIADFKRGEAYATLNDLLRYANLYSSNLFMGNNYFAKDLTFGAYINNISTTVFNYLLDCRLNIQEQFDKLNIKQKIGFIINGKMVSTQIKTNKINVNSMIALNVQAENIANIIFFNQNVSYPVLRSGSFIGINSFKNDLPIYVTIYPGYSLLIQNYNRVPLFNYVNSETEIKHYINIGTYGSNNLPYFFIIRRL